MRAVVVSKHGSPEALQFTTAADPTLNPGSVLIRTSAIAVNYIDTYHRSGLYPLPTPFIPGREGAGEVLATGTDVKGFEVGDRVAWCSTLGSYAELIAVPADQLVAMPSDIPDNIAASLLLKGMTADFLSYDTHSAKTGEWVLIHAGAGGVGQLLIQLCNQLGLNIIATASSSAKRELCLNRGAQVALSYEQATAPEIRRLSDGGVATVFDGVGAATFDTGLQCLKRRGSMVVFGAASGPVDPVDPQRLAAGGSLVLTRPKLDDFVATTDELRTRAKRVVQSWQRGLISIDVDQQFTLGDASEAHAVLESRKTTGATVLIP